MTQRRVLDPDLPEAFPVAAALASGVPVGRLRSSDLERPFHGVRSQVVGASASLMARCRSYLAVAPVEFAFSHETAAALYGIPLPRRYDGAPLHVSVPAGRSHVRRAGVVGHRGLTNPSARAGMPVAQVETVWLHLAITLTRDELIIAGDHIVQGRRPLSSIERLKVALDSASGQRGVALARRALAEVRVGVRSPRETWLRLVIVRAGLPEPVVAYAVHHEGAFVGTPDLAYPAWRIAIEYEGEHHRKDKRTYEEDIVRRELFRRAGWIVFLVTDRTLSCPNILLGNLEALVRERTSL